MRRFFNFGNAFPFDWWITPCGALNELLRDFDVDRLYTRELLEEVEGDDGAIASIRHREFGIIFQHEFPRKWDAQGNPVRPDWQEFLDRPRQRTKFLLDRLLSLNASGTRILFVRNALHPAVEGGQSPPITETAEQLRALFPQAGIQLALINCPTRVDDRSVTHLDFPDIAEDWQGDWRAWQPALSGTGWRLINATLRPFDKTAEPESQTEKISA